MQCLVLETLAVGESDLDAVLLTRDGRRLSARAKGAREMRSRLRAGLTSPGISDVKLIVGHNRWIAASATTSLPFPGFRTTHSASVGARIVVSLLRHAIVEFPDPDLYPAAVRLLRDLHTATLTGEKNHVLARRTVSVWVKALELVGFRPDFREAGPLSSEGTEALAARHVPHRQKDVETLLRYLGEHTIYHVPALRGTLRWAWGRLVVSGRAESATMQ